MDWEAIDAAAFSLMGQRKAHLLRERGFIYRHGKRVAQGVVALRKALYPGDASHDEALALAARFHDVGKGIEPHARTGALLFRDALGGMVPPGMLDEAAGYIAAHTDREARDPFAQLLQDGDVLDHFGTLEVGMAFQYGAYTEEGMEAVADYYRDEFDPYVQRVRDRLHYPLSIRVFEEKVAFTRAFVRRFLVEYAGGFWAFPEVWGKMP